MLCFPISSENGFSFIRRKKMKFRKKTCLPACLLVSRCTFIVELSELKERKRGPIEGTERGIRGERRSSWSGKEEIVIRIPVAWGRRTSLIYQNQPVPLRIYSFFLEFFDCQEEVHTFVYTTNSHYFMRSFVVLLERYQDEYKPIYEYVPLPPTKQALSVVSMFQQIFFGLILLQCVAEKTCQFDRFAKIS
jgi:hypothetical protein